MESTKSLLTEESRLELSSKLESHLNSRARDIYRRSSDLCKNQLTQVDNITKEYLLSKGFDLSEVCFVAVGSVGRGEALDASDIDLIPVLRSDMSFDLFSKHDQVIRELVSNKLGIKVSKGHDLTSSVCINQLVDSETIGGDMDDSSSLTKRILILTEGAHAGGGFKLLDIRKKILEAYSENERTRGRHVLSLCNDLARYYRTLCIEYKAKVDIEGKDWCTRNLKLRHSRKLWYFSSMISVASLANRHPDGETSYVDGLIQSFELTPALRLFFSTDTGQHVYVGRALNRFAWFLGFMAERKHRDELAKIEHANRYNVTIDNPFPMMKLNSDQMHSEIIRIIESLDIYMKQRIYDWFLL